MRGLRSLLPNAFYIARREYAMRVSTRSYLFSTLALAVVTVAVVIGPVFIEAISQGAQTKVGVFLAAADAPPTTVAVLDQSLYGASSVGDTPGTRRDFRVELVNDATAALADVRAGRLSGLLSVCRVGNDGKIPAPCAVGSLTTAPGQVAPAPGDLVFGYQADTLVDGRQVFFVRQAVNALAIQDRLTRSGVAPTDQARLFGPAALSFANPKKPAGSSASGGNAPQSDEDEVSRVLAATALIVLIFIFVISYGTWVAMSVAEEKGSRVMELMLNAATPLQMLAGKVVGTGLAGFTQYLVVLAAGWVGLLAQGTVAELVLGSNGGQSLPLGGIGLVSLLAFGVFFVLGFSLYALLYAAAGSMVSRQEDVQQAAMPLMMLSMIGYFASTIAIQGIDATWVTVLSFVPFFSPYLMLARVMLTGVAPWELVVSVVLLVLTIVVALWVAARIYSAGVLLYGQRVGLRKVLAAARVAR